MNEREIWSGHKLPGGVRWAECVRNMIGHKLPVGVGWAECGRNMIGHKLPGGVGWAECGRKRNQVRAQVAWWCWLGGVRTKEKSGQGTSCLVVLAGRSADKREIGSGHKLPAWCLLGRVQTKEKSGQGTSCLVVLAGGSADKREIGSGHKLPGGVGWAECGRKINRIRAQVAWWCLLGRVRTKEKLGQGTSCLVVSARRSVDKREIRSGHKLPGGVCWAECGRKRNQVRAQVAWWCLLGRVRTKEKLGQGTSCLVVSAGPSANQREIGSGHKLPGGVGWGECGRKRNRVRAQVAWWCRLGGVRTKEKSGQGTSCLVVSAGRSADKREIGSGHKLPGGVC